MIPPVSGQPGRLVLLPGLDGTGALFDPFLATLGSRMLSTVVEYSPEVARYVDCRAVAERRLPENEPYLLLGESFSGPVAIAIAATRPPGLRGVVLVGTFATSPSPWLRWLSFLIPLMPMHGPRRARELILLGRYASPELRALLQQALTSVAPGVLRARMNEIARVNMTTPLREIEAPILYLRGRDDRLVSAQCAEDIHRLGRSVQIVDVGAPHLILQCAASECVRSILEFAGECIGSAQELANRPPDLLRMRLERKVPGIE